MLETVERVAGACGRRDVVDLLGQIVHLGRKPAHGLVGGDVGRHIAQRGDGLLELRKRRRVLLRDDEIDLVRETGHCVVEADQVFRRRQPAQGIAHFGEPMFDAGNRAAVAAGLPAFGDALGKPLDLLLDGVDGAPRHGVVERAADLAKLGAQRIDRFLDARSAQRLDLVGDLAKMILQPGQVLGWHRREHRRGRRHGGRRPLPPRGRLAQGLLTIERALAGGDFGDGAVERRRQLHAPRHHRRDLRRQARQVANWSSRWSRRAIKLAIWSGSLRPRFGA